jgi:hypothetical protein
VGYQVAKPSAFGSATSRNIFWLKWDANEAAVCGGDDKLVVFENENNSRLYMLFEDIDESQDVKIDHLEVAKELKSEFDEWRKLLIEPVFDPLGIGNPSL